MNTAGGGLPPRLAAAWQLFADWCSANGVSPLPASPAVVLRFLSALPAAGSTQARRVAAINAAHDAAGLASPGRDPRVREWVGRARGLRPGAGTDRSRRDAWLAISRLPTQGWPRGLFGRRDAVALLVCRVAGLPAGRARMLAAKDVRLDEDGRLHVGGHAVTTGEDNDPRLCPACVWLRWQEMLHLNVRFASARGFAARLNKPAPQGHLCAQPRPTALPPETTVITPIDRWAAMGIHPQPMSRRALSGLIAAHMAGRPPTRHDLADPNPPPAPAPPPIPEPARRTAKQLRQQFDNALTAQRHARQVSGDLDVLFDRLEAGIADLGALLTNLDADTGAGGGHTGGK